METLPVRLYAAFAADERGGNIGGVVYEDAPLWPEARQRIAADLGAPTTGFVRQISENRIQTRFHSTRSEMDMCGHVTVAVFAALLKDGRIGPGSFVQETSAGEIGVDVAADGAITMHQPLPKFGLNDASAGEIAPLLGMEASAVLGVTAASTGLRHVFVQLAGLDALAGIRPDDEGLRRFSHERSIDTIGVWCQTASALGKAKVRLRDLCHGVGDPEEAASGTTNGALASALFRSGKLQAGGGGQAVLVAEQGVEMGRPSIIRTVLATSGKDVTGVSVGGYASLRLVGEVVL
ncbi:PhzF family phenazine biosynthesis protein [Roseibium sp. M-1]